MHFRIFQNSLMHYWTDKPEKHDHVYLRSQVVSIQNILKLFFYLIQIITDIF